MIPWSSLPEWRILEREGAYVIKVANTIGSTFLVTAFRDDLVEFDIYYTQGERLIGYALRLKAQIETRVSPWYVWVHGEVGSKVDLIYQDPNVRMLKFDGSSYMLVMRWQVLSKED